MDYVTILLGVVAALLYASIGYAAQDAPFDSKKFLRTFVIGTFTALGLDLGGMTFNVYTAIVGPPAITMFLQKLIDTGAKSVTVTTKVP